MQEEPVGCTKPTGRVIGEKANSRDSNENNFDQGENNMVIAKVGEKAPDFEAPAYHKEKFISVKLSDYLGKWVLLCFYPGDFTFV